MTYISANGNLARDGQGWSLSRVPDLFWGLANFIVLFFQTLINPELSSRGNRYVSDYRAPGRGLPPGPPRRRFGGLPRSGGASAPPVSGGG